MINQKDIPILLEKLWASIDKVQGALLDNFTLKKSGSTREYYGFDITESWGKVWLGFWTTTWKEYATPIVLHVSKSSISEPDKEKVIRLLKEVNFEEYKKDNNPEYIYPVQIQEAEIVAEIEKQVRKCLTHVKDGLAKH